MKTSKKRLMELAAINNPFKLSEAVDPNFPVKLTINVTARDIMMMFDETELGGAITGTFADAQQFNELVKTMNDDLNNWFSNEGVQWLDDGLNADVYADFQNYEN